MDRQKYTVEELLETESFRKWVRGEASLSQKEYWDTWVMTEKQHRKLARHVIQEMAGFALDPEIDPDADNAWKRLDHRLNPEGSDINPVNTKETAAKFVDLKWIYRIAAGLLIVLTTGLMFHFTTHKKTGPGSQITEHRVLTEYGEQKKIRLGDGSIINLNANSELIYKVSPSRPTDINVELKGEAFFNVSERTTENQHPFKVKTADGCIIRVLGTRFSVSTRDEKTQVVLEKGSVQVNVTQETKQSRRQVILEPNHLAEFDSASDTLVVQGVNTDVYTSWTSEELVFDHTPLPIVLKRIEYTFGVEIKLKDPALNERILSGTIDNGSRDVILSTLAQVLSIPVEINGDIVYFGQVSQ